MAKYDVFISHSTADDHWASQFADVLRGEGIRTWSDQEVAPGESIPERMEEALRESRMVVVFLTPDLLTSPSTSFELGAAVAGNKKIVPILRENLKRDQIPYHLRHLRFIQESSPDAAGKTVAELAKASMSTE